MNAGELYIGDKLLDANGKTLIVEDRQTEILDEPVKVYNFQVEDFHTYHVGESKTLVHNADYIGANGTQLSGSEKVWKNGKTERLEVENFAPGERPGNIHYHDSKTQNIIMISQTGSFIMQKQAQSRLRRYKTY